MHLVRRQIPDKELVKKIRRMIKEGKGPKRMKRELQDTPLCVIRRYYTKIRRGTW